MSSSGGSQMSARRESQDTDALRIESPLCRSGSHDTNCPRRVLQRRRVMITRTKPGLQNKCRNPDRVEPLGNWPTLVLCEMRVSTSGADDDGGTRRLLFRRQVGSKGGNIAGLVTQGASRPRGPNNNWSFGICFNQRSRQSKEQQ